MKIPRSFELQGRTIRVVSADDLSSEVYAEWNADQDLISFDPDVPKDLRYHNFLHECVHAWMDALGREDLSKDEHFIDALAGLVHQMLKTGR